MATDKTKKAPKLPKAARRIAGKRVKEPWRRRKSAVPLSYADKVAMSQKREKEKAELQDALEQADLALWEIAEELHKRFPKRAAKHYYHLLMQRSNAKKPRKKISLWNVFVSRNTRANNDEQADRQRVSSDFIKTLAERWRNMTAEEREEAAADGVEEMNDRLVNQKQGAHRYHEAAFTDASKTLASLESELATLHMRTDMEAILVVTRGHWDDIHMPFVYATPKGDRAFTMLANMTGKEFAIRMEGYCIMGIQGMTKNHREQVNALKQACKVLIFQKLQAAAVRGAPTKMYYVNFEYYITSKFGVVLENWPLQKFAAPGSFSSLPVLTVLYNAWQNDAARFRSLSDAEWTTWRETYDRGVAADVVTVAPQAFSAETDATIEDEDGGDLEPAGAPEPEAEDQDGTPATTPTPPAGSAAASASHPSQEAPAAVTATTGQKRPFAQFINSVAAPDGSGIQVTKRPRKERSDKGKKRPKKTKPTSENTPPVAA